ncbi:hypothetical protein IQ06DRAFT_344199 [Phaeosphaeriaceae sp. SRC1lsM3a]|nr:hypothetical protein IQ06DRAFT_344199 [Stagonospora sp. SRC1lsM3a]
MPIHEIHASMGVQSSNLLSHDNLGHHPGGLADEYHLADMPALLPVAHIPLRPVTASEGSDYALYDINTAFTRKAPPPLAERPLLQRAYRSQEPRAQRARPLSIVSENFTVANPHGIEQDALTDTAADATIPMARPAEHRMALSTCSSTINAGEDDHGNPMVRPCSRGMVISVDWSDLDTYDGSSDDSVARSSSRRMIHSDASDEDIADSTPTCDIAMTRPAHRRMSLSDCFEHDIPMAQAAQQRMSMSDCFSVGSADDIGETFEFIRPDRADSVASHRYYDPMGIRATRKAVNADMYMGRREGFAHTAAFDQAPTRQSVTVEFCSASSSSSNDEDEVHSSSPPEPEAPQSPPSLIATSSFDSIDVSYPGSCSSNTSYTSAEQASALRVHSPSQAGLWRFAHLDYPYAKPIDQSLLADFDEDFSDEDEYHYRV